MIARYLLNVFIYDNSREHRLKLKKIVRDYAENNSIALGAAVSAARPNKILNLPPAKPGLYLLNIDDLEKKIDWIEFAKNIRDNDLDGSIVFLSEHDIFATSRSDLAIRSINSFVIPLSFLAKDSVEYENKIKECIATHIRRKMCLP